MIMTRFLKPTGEVIAKKGRNYFKNHATEDIP
jgi:hypothetical protein